MNFNVSALFFLFSAGPHGIPRAAGARAPRARTLRAPPWERPDAPGQGVAVESHPDTHEAIPALFFCRPDTPGHRPRPDTPGHARTRPGAPALPRISRRVFGGASSARYLETSEIRANISDI